MWISVLVFDPSAREDTLDTRCLMQRSSIVEDIINRHLAREGRFFVKPLMGQAKAVAARNRSAVQVVISITYTIAPKERNTSAQAEGLGPII